MSVIPAPSTAIGVAIVATAKAGSAVAPVPATLMILTTSLMVTT